jgi:hypothetical protein
VKRFVAGELAPAGVGGHARRRAAGAFGRADAFRLRIREGGCARPQARVSGDRRFLGRRRAASDGDRRRKDRAPTEDAR